MASSTSRGAAKGSLAGSWLEGANREGRCQLSRAGCGLTSQHFSLPAAPGFGAGTFAFPETSQEAPERVGKPKVPGKPGGSAVGLWLAGVLGTGGHSTSFARG